MEKKLKNSSLINRFQMLGYVPHGASHRQGERCCHVLGKVTSSRPQHIYPTVSTSTPTETPSWPLSPAPYSHTLIPSPTQMSPSPCFVQCALLIGTATPRWHQEITFSMLRQKKNTLSPMYSFLIQGRDFFHIPLHPEHLNKTNQPYILQDSEHWKTASVISAIDI